MFLISFWSHNSIMMRLWCSKGVEPTENVEDKADEAVVGGKRQKHLVNQNDMLEVVNDAFAIKKVHGGS